MFARPAARRSASLDRNRRKTFAGKNLSEIKDKLTREEPTMTTRRPKVLKKKKVTDEEIYNFDKNLQCDQ